MLVLKQLVGQEKGYAMAALLVALSVMAVLMTAAMPVWKQISQREKEEELVFRGQQYARAVGLFQRRAGPGVLPPSVDVLVQQRFLRKKYKDPITNDDFDLVRGGTAGATAQPGQIANPTGGTPSAPAGDPRTGLANSPPVVAGGISGVVSKSKAASIRLYNGRSHYNEWVFIFTPAVQAPGAGQRGGQPPQPPGPGPGRPGTVPTNPFGGPAQPRPQTPPPRP